MNEFLNKVETLWQKDAGIDKKSNLFVKMKENLETARDLMDSLKREKWRLSRREMSVELRMDEMEEYKTHMKRDMTDMNQTVDVLSTDMNQTVDVLSVRVVQLENSLCEEQEKQESMEAEQNDILIKYTDEQKKTKSLEEEIESLTSEINSLKSSRTDLQLRQMNEDMSNKMEVLMLENHSLKDMIREREDEVAKLQEELEKAKIAHSKDLQAANRDSLTHAMKRVDLERDTDIEYV